MRGLHLLDDGAKHPIPRHISSLRPPLSSRLCDTSHFPLGVGQPLVALESMRVKNATRDRPMSLDQCSSNPPSRLPSFPIRRLHRRLSFASLFQTSTRYNKACRSVRVIFMCKWIVQVHVFEWVHDGPSEQPLSSRCF